MKNAILVTLAASGLLVLSGCSGMSTVNQDFVMAGNAEGLRAWSDGLVGALKTSKESPDSENQYLTTRRHNERERTLRDVPPSFLQKLLSSDAPTSPGQGS